MRSKWRTKQNIDFSYLMMYAQSRGRYYCQMEDDVIAKPGTVIAERSLHRFDMVLTWADVEFMCIACFKLSFTSCGE